MNHCLLFYATKHPRSVVAYSREHPNLTQSRILECQCFLKINNGVVIKVLRWLSTNPMQPILLLPTRYDGWVSPFFGPQSTPPRYSPTKVSAHNKAKIYDKVWSWWFLILTLVLKTQANFLPHMWPGCLLLTRELPWDV